MAVYTIDYDGQRIKTKDISATHDEIKSQIVGRWPELSNADMHVSDDNVITFSLREGTKN